MAETRYCDSCRAGCTWRRRTCRKCAQKLCVFCREAPCNGGRHDGAAVIMRAVNGLAEAHDARALPRGGATS